MGLRAGDSALRAYLAKCISMAIEGVSLQIEASYSTLIDQSHSEQFMLHMVHRFKGGLSDVKTECNL